MKLTILGNNGPYPAPGGACSGYLLTSGDGRTNVLIDCGTGVLARLIMLDAFRALDAVILSHLHYDHMSDMLPMQYALQFNPRLQPLPVCAPETPAEARALLNAPCYELRKPGDMVVGGMRIRFVPARHPVETYAVAVECDGARCVFTGDSNTDEGVERFCAGADLLLADCGLSEADYRPAAPHYSARLCGELAASAGAKRLLLTHFNPKYDPGALLREAQTAFPAAMLAEAGMEVVI